VKTLERKAMAKKAEKQRSSEEEHEAAVKKAARNDVQRFLADDNEDLKLERSDAEDDIVSEFFPATDTEPETSENIRKYFEIPNIALATNYISV
jgi:hypothetical protein